MDMLQQYLPFTVLKPSIPIWIFRLIIKVATVLTVYGIETQSMYYTIEKRYNVATVLIVYGIETFR